MSSSPITSLSRFNSSVNSSMQSHMNGSTSEPHSPTTPTTPNEYIDEDDAENKESIVEINGDEDGEHTVSQKKKKKKKPKKSATAKAKEAAEKAAKMKEAESAEARPSVLCISRNKHWRYISSYHGPWLQLPIELLESLLALNLDPATLSSETPPLLNPPFSASTGSNVPNMNVPGGNVRLRDRGLQSLNVSDTNGIFTNPNAYTTLDLTFPSPAPNSIPTPKTGTAPPPPIDPGVFRSVASIRRLIDEAAELSVRATSGLSAAELGSMRGSPNGFGGGGYGGGYGGGSAWTAAQTLGINPNTLAGGRNSGAGRNVAMSAMRIHRLRALAVQKLAEAYKQDEIASSVMVMQGGSVFDDIAERVLRVDPDDANAKYVHFFHEKIPSRQLAESTTTRTLDELISAHPHRLEYFRTRGIVHCFRDEYQQAIRDFTHALKEARAVRKSRSSHSTHSHQTKRHSFGGGHTHGHSHNRSSGVHTPTKHSKMPKKKGKAGGKGGKGGRTNGQAPPNGTSSAARTKLGGDSGGDVDGEDGYEDAEDEQDRDGDPNTNTPPPHPSVLPDAPDPIEPQLLFLRGSAFLQQAVWLIEQAVLKLEGIDPSQPRTSSNGTVLTDNGDLRLCYLQDGKYGGVEVGNPQGPLGVNDGIKVKAYQEVLGDKKFKEQIFGMIRKSIRDHEKFLGHFDSLEVQPPYSSDQEHQGAFITEVDMSGNGKGKGVDEEDFEELEEKRKKKEEKDELKRKVEYAFYLSESIRPGNQGVPPTPTPSPGTASSTATSNGSQLVLSGSYMLEGPGSSVLPPPTIFTTYHPLLVEAHFSILLCLLLLGDFQKILPTFIRTAALVDGLEGYPVFLPPRSMAQAEFVEILERLAGGWKRGAETDEEASTAEQRRKDVEKVASTRSSTPTSSTSGEASTSVSGIGSSAANSGYSTPMTSSVDLSEPFDSSSRSVLNSGSSSSGCPSGSRSTPTNAATPVPTCSSSKVPRPDHGGDSRLAREDAPEALDALRILLAPVVARQKLRAEQAAAEKATEKAERRERAASRAKDKSGGDKEEGSKASVGGGGEKKKPMSINIPLHGPRVEVVLAWLGGVHLPELDF
ncbi:hypothetical protein K435DRAFT_965768 [Dendrothele bispora CBS 962.96]|uniref:Uncharacterized protein n=1 Tax=Dendrothele bispora (strain CBS 962.96) TaxID=1314807 RepID=A0A4S8M3Y9_DENBC|nr:hypothetical protein K435DRAFT_965768 [Dendrothele bispora CBS 962.96]